ncbi:geranylgeranylglyceryl/heptaprenylglyceryl phosphate synthase [Halegenticoccus tardaugens]|uniref:geranylgeranylglyceryl/heptaprenylglyceryl phosphate synthase n=1 Tax=Halegenticoccus tardaugens TaxID=2071624 RepID=UPI001E34CCEB|nr:geranylgeranylglyceryl/heptaprenylglyceryl phosphate synthase [Halegenticoccus tardaugens]
MAHGRAHNLGSNDRLYRLGTHVSEAYIVLNPASAVATVTHATFDLTTAEATAYAQATKQLLGQEIVYLEYSGTLGDPNLVAAVREALSSATLFNGGGIHEYDSASEMATVADTVVVGDLVHERGIVASKRRYGEPMTHSMRRLSDRQTRLL